LTMESDIKSEFQDMHGRLNHLKSVHITRKIRISTSVILSGAMQIYIASLFNWPQRA
jgi:hypothetical protein